MISKPHTPTDGDGARLASGELASAFKQRRVRSAGEGLFVEDVLSDQRDAPLPIFRASDEGQVDLGMTGTVITVRKRGIFGHSGKHEIRANAARIGENSIRLRGAKNGQGKGQGTLSIATAAVVALPLIFITGKSAVIKPGTQFIAYTDQDY